MASWLEEESTVLAVREYISQAGEGKFLVILALIYLKANQTIAVDSMGMAQAISRHLADINDEVMPPARGRIVRQIQRTISS